jgi:hypothetical protein
MKMINPTPINPKGFTNINNIQSMFGTQVPNTFTRDVSNPYDTTNTLATSPGVSPTPPPTGVEMPIVPPYDINNY